MLQTLECKDLDLLAVMDRFTGVAVFVDQALGAPGQVVAQHVIGKLGEGADAQDEPEDWYRSVPVRTKAITTKTLTTVGKVRSMRGPIVNVEVILVPIQA